MTDILVTNEMTCKYTCTIVKGFLINIVKLKKKINNLLELQPLFTFNMLTNQTFGTYANYSIF